MVFFITFLRALGTCLITNAHYTGVYPTDLIANGGLIGDVLFFAVSGYCLYNVKGTFLKWYGKRLYRVYVPTLVMTAVYVLAGQYSLSEHSSFWWFVYPTYYHFVASIVVLYIPFFFCMKAKVLREHIVHVMIVIAAAWIAVYFTVYDKSYYHIDTVREPMIRFLFMESMLLGAWFKQNDAQFRNRFRMIYPIGSAVLFVFYFASKLLFSRRSEFAPFQFVNQLAIFALLVLLFRTFAGLDSKLERLPGKIKKLITFLSGITLEIYLVQYVIIAVVRPVAHFPVNWILLTASILTAAYLLHVVCGYLYEFVEKLNWGG